MRRLLFAIAGVLLALTATLLLALRSESFVLGAAHWAVGTFTDLRLELRNPRVDVYRGSVSADEIHLVPVTGNQPALLSLLGFSAEFPVPAVSGGPVTSAIEVDAVLVYVSASGQSDEPEPMQWLGYLRWLPAELRIGQVHLVSASANTWIFPLKQLHGKRLDSSNYALTADADYDGEPLGIAIDLVSVDKGWGATDADVSIRLSAPASGSEFSLAGTLEGTTEDFHYNFDLNAYYRDIREFLKGFEGRDKLAGELRMQGTLTGDTSRFVLSDATFLLNNFPEYGFQAGGSLEYQFSGKSSLALVANGELATLSYLVNWIDLDVSDFGRASSTIRLSGSLDKPVIDEFSLTTSSDSGLTVAMSGQLNLFELDADKGPEGNAISVDLQGPSLGALQHWLGELPFEPGSWRASAQLTGNRNELALQDIVLEMGSPDSVQVRAVGAIGRIHSTGGAYALSDILLSVEAHAPDSADLGALLKLNAIPPHQEVRASLVLSGNGQQLQLDDGKLVISASDLEANIGPLTALLRPAQSQPLSDLAAPVLIKLSDTAALSQYLYPYTSRPIPVLGPLQISARLGQEGATFQLLDIIATVREGDLNIESRGRIGNLASFSDVSLSSKVAGLDARSALTALLADFNYDAPLGSVDGSFELVEKQGIWSLSRLAMSAGNDQLPFAFSLDGKITDLAGMLAADLESRFRLDDPSLLAALTGRALQPVEGSLVMATSEGQISGILSARVGDTVVRGEAQVATVENKVQAVQVAISTPHLHLQDFGFAPAQDSAEKEKAEHAVASAQTPVADTAGTAPTAATPLARMREKSPPFPVDFRLNVDGISGKSSRIDSLQVHVTGTDGRFTLEQFSASYDGALAEIRGVIDLNPEPPALSLAGQATALPLSAILEDVGVDADVSGTLTVLGGVTVMGDTPDTMVRTLNGSVALALENAVIEGAAYDLLATDLLAWIYSGALTEKSTHLDCTMAKFQLSQGVATTDSLYIESSKMVASGKAKFDLVKRRMDLRITPLSKSRLLQVPSEVRLKGDMSSPKAEVSAINAVADATSAALMLIPSLTLKLFGVNQPSVKSYRPCQADLGN